MPSTRPRKGESSSKRSNLPRQSNFDADFLKDWIRYDRTGRFRMADVKAVMGLLVDNDAPLPAQYRDHALKGEWAGSRECHVHGDLLLVYRIVERQSVETVVFVARGTHSELSGR